MGDTLADTLSEYSQLADSQQQLPPRPAPGKPPTPAAPGPPIVQPIPAGPAGPPKPVKSPGIVQALGGLVGRAMIPGAALFSTPQQQDQDVETAKGLAVGVLRAPYQLVGGTVDTLADAGKFIDDNIKSPFLRSAANVATGNVPALANAARKAFTGGASLADKLSDRQNAGQAGNPNVNQFTAEAGGAALGTGNPEGFAQTVLRSALGGALALSADPNHPLRSRLENAAAAGALGGAFHIVAGALTGDLLAKATKITEATPAEAAQDGLDRAFASKRTTDARYAAVEPKGPQEPQEQEVTPPGRHTDGPPPVSGEPGTPRGSNGSGSPAEGGLLGQTRPEVTDANAALEQSGAAERIPEDGTHQLDPDGKFPVSQASKDALDEAGLGRTFRSSSEDLPPEPVIFKETSADGSSSRVVGSIPKDDLDGFLQDVEHFRANPWEVAQDASHPTGQWALPRLGSIDDVGAFARALSDRIPGQEAQGNVEALAAATQKATGMDPGDIARLVAETASDASKVRDATLTVRLLHQKAMQELSDVADPSLRYAFLGPDDAPVQRAVEAIHNALTLHTHANILKAEAGRALQLHGVDLNDSMAGQLGLKPGDEISPDTIPDLDAFKDNFGKTPDEQLPAKDPRKGPGLPRTPKELDDWLKAYKAAQQMDDPAVLNRFLNAQPISIKKWLYLRNSFVNFFTGSIVSAPRTLIRDMWGPAIISGFNTVGRSLGSGINAVNPLLSEAERAAAWAASWSAPRAHAMAMLDSLDALKQAASTMGRQFAQAPGTDPFLSAGANLGTSHSLLGGHNPVDVNLQGVPSALIHAATQTDPGVTGSVPFWAGNLINKWPQVVQALHGGANEMAMRLAYSGNIRATAYQDAAKLGLQGDDFNAFVRNRLDASVDPLNGSASDDAALDAAQRTALIRRPTANDPYALRKALEIRADIVREVPEARFIMPIFTVPANAMGETLRRIPIVNLIGQETRNELMGNAGVVAQGDAYGRMLTGGASLLAGWGLARNGVLTGAGPAEPNARRVWEQTHQPYSVRVGDKWYSYSKSDIIGPMLGIIAGSYDHTVYHPGDETLGAHAWAAAMGLAGYFKDQASLKGLSDLMNIGGNPQESAGSATRLLGGIMGGYVPGFVEQLAREVQDPLNRVKTNPWDYIKDRLPGASEQLDPARNVLGEPTHKPASPGLNSFPISIANQVTYQKDPVLDELSRLYQSTGYAPGVLPTSAGNGSHQDLRNLKAEDGYSVYEHQMRALQSVTNDEGQTLRQALQATITSPDYADAPDGHGRVSNQDGSSDLTRGGILQKTFDDFHKLAKQQAAQESPASARYMAAAMAKAHDQVHLGSHSVSDLASPQGEGLLKSLGIDINQYEQTVKGNP